MARKARTKTKAPRRFRPVRWLLRWSLRVVCIAFLIATALITLGAVINPPLTPYMWAERQRLGGVDHQWVPLEEIAPVMARSAVAAEDANFCLHWGFDLPQIRAAIAEGSGRGASTISQQVVKNVFLWHGRSWFRKGLEALMTPLLEAIWSKRRIIEVYLNVAELEEGVFGVEAASRAAFGKGPEALSAREAARLAAVLPNPKGRSAARPSASVERRARAIADGAETIRADGRAACFED
ncbi:MAG: monofunctional biosynthetic peptidoglycan transglycosylase [Pseudomonadota bacterium]